MDNQTNTLGGTYIGEGLNTGGGDFVGRDKIVIELSKLSHNILAVLSDTLEIQQNSPIPNRKVLFEQHIEPAYKKLEAVHKDYEKTFYELMQKLKKDVESQCMSEIIPGLLDWVTGKSLIYRSERAYLMNVYIELDVVIARTTQDIKIAQPNDSEIPIAMKVFSTAIIQYFDSATILGDPYNRQSYMALTYLLDQIVQEQNEENHLNHLMTFKKILDIISKKLPSSWELVTRSYLKLRGLCLS